MLQLRQLIERYMRNELNYEGFRDGFVRLDGSIQDAVYVDIESLCAALEHRYIANEDAFKIELQQLIPQQIPVVQANAIRSAEFVYQIVRNAPRVGNRQAANSANEFVSPFGGNSPLMAVIEFADA